MKIDKRKAYYFENESIFSQFLDPKSIHLKTDHAIYLEAKL